jgi:poly(hydroxyalkanoate) granule-associated protein
MLDLLKQSIFTSVGLACLAREKVEQLAAEVAHRAQLSEQEANDFQAQLVRRAEQAQQDLRAEIDQRIDHAFIQLGILKAGVRKAGESARGELQTPMDQRIDAALQRLGIARADEVEALTHRIELLEKNVRPT